jgi:S1-C subfamily serine protease
MKRTTLNRVALLIASLGYLFGVAQAHADEQVYATGVRSTVLVMTPASSGSGVLVDSDRRWIVTNEHVVESHSEIAVFFPAERFGWVETELEYYRQNRQQLEIKGRVISLCRQRDLALVELERLPAGATAIEFGQSARPGQLLHSIGNPSASDALWVYTNGYVRANYFKTINARRMQVVETSAPINPGDSGGPILNSAGQLVGITQSFHKEGRLVSNGVDICEVIWFVNKQRRTGEHVGLDGRSEAEAPAPTPSLAQLKSVARETTTHSPPSLLGMLRNQQP